MLFGEPRVPSSEASAIGTKAENAPPLAATANRAREVESEVLCGGAICPDIRARLNDPLPKLLISRTCRRGESLDKFASVGDRPLARTCGYRAPCRRVLKNPLVP